MGPAGMRLSSGEPASPEEFLVSVDDLDHDREFVRIDPEITFATAFSCIASYRYGRRGGSVATSWSNPLSSHASPRRPPDCRPEESHTRPGRAAGAVRRRLTSAGLPCSSWLMERWRPLNALVPVASLATARDGDPAHDALLRLTALAQRLRILTLTDQSAPALGATVQS